MKLYAISGLLQNKFKVWLIFDKWVSKNDGTFPVIDLFNLELSPDSKIE